MNKLLLALTTILLMSCANTGLKVGSWDVGKLVNQGVAVWDSQNMTEEKEYEIGQRLSSLLLGVRPLLDNNDLQQYVNQVGYHLASHSSRPHLNWRFGIIHSNEINAFAAPGGFVFITSAFVLQLNSEAELAAVLAHEIAHVTEQHHLNRLQSDSLRGALTDVAFMSADAYQSNTGASSQQRQYTQYAKALSGMAMDLYTKGLDRDDELAADAKALSLLAKAGYDVYAMAASLQRVDAIASDDYALAMLYQTHPKPQERLALITKQINQLENDNQVPEGVMLVTRYQQKVKVP